MCSDLSLPDFRPRWRTLDGNSGYAVHLPKLAENVLKFAVVAEVDGSVESAADGFDFGFEGDELLGSAEFIVRTFDHETRVGCDEGVVARQPVRVLRL